MEIYPGGMKMKKKIVTISILAVFILVAISYATAVNATNTEKKESPLYGLRAKRAIREKLGDLIENIKTKFLGSRIFFLPFQWSIINILNRDATCSATYCDTEYCTYCDCSTMHEKTCFLP